jgi:hypothetical protein
MTFQKTVLIVAAVILIIVLCLVGISMWQNKKNTKFPPVIGECPDYWTDQSGKGDGSMCINQDPDPSVTPSNTEDKNVCDCNQCDFSTSDYNTPKSWGDIDLVTDNNQTAGWQSGKGICAKKNFAQLCGLSWDGITNTRHNCP